MLLSAKPRAEPTARVELAGGAIPTKEGDRECSDSCPVSFSMAAEAGQRDAPMREARASAAPQVNAFQPSGCDCLHRLNIVQDARCDTLRRPDACSAIRGRRATPSPGTTGRTPGQDGASGAAKVRARAQPRTRRKRRRLEAECSLCRRWLSGSVSQSREASNRDERRTFPAARLRRQGGTRHSDVVSPESAAVCHPLAARHSPHGPLGATNGELVHAGTGEPGSEPLSGGAGRPVLHLRPKRLVHLAAGQ